MVKEKYYADDDKLLLSYSKINGKKIKDISGYVSHEFDEPVFKICRIDFEDGSSQGVGAWHDCAYLVDCNEETWKILDSLLEEEMKEEI